MIVHCDSSAGFRLCRVDYVPPHWKKSRGGPNLPASRLIVGDFDLLRGEYLVVRHRTAPSVAGSACDFYTSRLTLSLAMRLGRRRLRREHLMK